MADEKETEKDYDNLTPEQAVTVKLSEEDIESINRIYLEECDSFTNRIEGRLAEEGKGKFKMKFIVLGYPRFRREALMYAPTMDSGAVIFMLAKAIERMAVKASKENDMSSLLSILREAVDRTVLPSAGELDESQIN